MANHHSTQEIFGGKTFTYYWRLRGFLYLVVVLLCVVNVSLFPSVDLIVDQFNNDITLPPSTISLKNNDTSTNMDTVLSFHTLRRQHPMVLDILQQKNWTSVSTTAFNVTHFWKQAWETALHSRNQRRKKEQLQQTLSCPKVFVYNLSSDLQDGEDVTLTSHSTGLPSFLSVDNVFGSDQGMDGQLRDTNQYSLARILYYRLLQSPSSCLTINKEEADLFFIPIHTAPKSSSEWKQRCRPNNNIPDKLLSQLVHLEPQTACRHLMVLSKGHYVGAPCQGWWSNPVPALQSSMRVAYSDVPFLLQKDEYTYVTQDPDEEAFHRRYPHLFSVPYPSSFHWRSRRRSSSSPPPWKHDANNITKKGLMLYLGRPHGDVDVRTKIQNVCDKIYQDHSLCKARFPRRKENSYMQKQDYIFCLEPMGDSPWRKSLSDDLTFRCIPVFFGNLTDTVATWHWGEWKSQARVLVDREAFLQGSVDLALLLSSVPAGLLELLWETISENAQGFQYSLDDDPHDGIRILLDRLKAQSIHMEEANGQCTH